MTEGLLRSEAKAKEDAKLEVFGKKMRKALSILSKSEEGILLLRFLMHEGHMFNALTYVTVEKINTDVLIENEGKRKMYLNLRKYMDRDTVMRVELPAVEEPKKEGGQNG